MLDARVVVKTQKKMVTPVQGEGRRTVGVSEGGGSPGGAHRCAIACAPVPGGDPPGSARRLAKVH